jgi:hypothetical protein
MVIETTLHVHKCIFEKLDNAALRNMRSRTSIIKLLIQRTMRDHRRMIKTYSRIKYQKRDIKENWNIIHIVLNEYEYEYFLDIRKFFKMSVSFILAYAVMRYLDELLKMGKSTDNYCYNSYILIKETVDGIVCWKTYWGIPSKGGVFSLQN